ncbi:MAG: hypothetical protein WCB31_09520 [Nitrososphaeraceae archaeon]
MVSVFLPTQNPFDEARRKVLLREYAEAVCSLPTNDNPVNDSNGSKAGLINRGNPNVFKLAHSRSGPANRNIQVKVGNVLFIPVMSGIVTQPEVPNATSLQQCADKDQSSITSVGLEVNGSAVQNLGNYRVMTDEFNVNHPQNNINQVPSGNHKALAKSIVVMVKCDQPETFKIKWNGNLNCNGADCIEQNYSEDITYTIKVEP